jgi:hypothetical protein
VASSVGFHEDDLSAGTKDRHRAIVSLQEELEAIDWYDQRIEAATDPDLKDLLRHNRDEEKEHASMLLEWIRRQDPAFDATLRQYLFTDGPIKDPGTEAAGSPGGDLQVGALAGKEVL